MYSRPASPRPTRSPVRGTAPTLTTAVEDSQPRLRSPGTPLQAQGRNVVSRDGQRGVMSDRNRFQPLGTAALNRLGGGGGQTASDVEAAVNNRPGVFGATTGSGAGTGAGGDIQTAIRGLKSQLGMPAGTDADTNTFNKMTGFGPNVQGMGPAVETALAGANGGNPNFAPSMPPDVASRLRSMIGIEAPKSAPVPYFGDDEMSINQGAGAGTGGGATGIRPNIRPEIIRDVMQGAGAGGAGSGGMAPFGSGGRGSGNVGFMPGQPNPYAEILRQRLGAGAGASGGGGMAGQYVY